MPEAYDQISEKPIRNRTLPCCGRTVCALCIESNPRFENYCPFCQTGKLPSVTELKTGAPPQPKDVDPPPYTPILGPVPSHTPPPAPRPHHAILGDDISPNTPQDPPAYDSAIHGFTQPGASSISSEQAVSNDVPQDVIHYLSPDDSMQTLSIAYGVPTSALRSHNSLHSDHLLSARRTIKIPAHLYRGPSLSPNPLESEEEVERKSKIRKLMVQCKISEYKMAHMYLEEVKWDLDKAIERVEEDDRWEKEHPMLNNSAAGPSASTPSNLFGRKLRLAEPLSPTRIANLLR